MAVSFRARYTAYSVLILALIAACVAPLAFPAAASAGSRVSVVLGLPATQLPESIAIDHQGNLYLSIETEGQIFKVLPGGTPSVYATFPAGLSGPGITSTLGIRFGKDGAAYVAVAFSGIWRIPPGGGTPVLVAPLPGFVNGLAFDHEGNLYVSESLSGAIYRLTPGGSLALWASGPLLVGTTDDGPCGDPHPSGYPLGANGIAFTEHGGMLVTNTTLGTVVRIPVKADGSAGTARVFAGPDCRLWGADGVAMDNRGNLYVAANAERDIVRISPHGRMHVLASYADGDPLYSPSDIAFGARNDRKHIFITNFAAFTEGDGAGVVTMDVGIPGHPLP